MLAPNLIPTEKDSQPELSIVPKPLSLEHILQQSDPVTKAAQLTAFLSALDPADRIGRVSINEQLAQQLGKYDSTSVPLSKIDEDRIYLQELVRVLKENGAYYRQVDPIETKLRISADWSNVRKSLQTPYSSFGEFASALAEVPIHNFAVADMLAHTAEANKDFMRQLDELIRANVTPEDIKLYVGSIAGILEQESLDDEELVAKLKEQFANGSIGLSTVTTIAQTLHPRMATRLEQLKQQF